ncbi:glycoside hydrolase family 32 protein [Teratosphaeria destructans]|uniref:Glycoside hydrolase family 32 protein n=1 Tax=Teratosphaeria destructans TaxID=418781 RepID=A0A9W7W3M2_9PEZI|nr:glycoside hydrolase family 32 protein [Teratosphaeria destructans]
MDLFRRTALATILFNCVSSAVIIDYHAPPPNISTLFNNTIYYTWRPKSHVLPPYGHTGDPCAHFYDPADGSFHVGYLFSAGVGPSGIAGAITDDLVTYFDVDENPTIIYNGGINDPVAVFDGSVIPSGINGTPTLLYTSVSYLPIHWTIPYIKGSDAESGRRNFTKVKQGPVIPGPPFPITNPTGFRDPYVFQNPRLDRAVASANGTWYTTISGGIHDVGPCVFLFRQYDANFRDWEFLGQWWQEPANSTWGDGTWAGRWGFNFETGNVFGLSQAGYDAEGMIFTTNGAEWSEAPIIPQVSQFREMLWAAHDLTTGPNGTHHGGKARLGHFGICCGGQAPTIWFYAFGSIRHVHDRFVIYLWLTNNDFGNNGFPTAQQGWDGALTTVRELAQGTVASVVDNGLIAGPASWIVAGRDTSAGTVELTTLKQTIAREVYAAFMSKATRTFVEPARTITASNSSGVDFVESPVSKAFMLKTCLTFPPAARNSPDLQAGLRILTSDQESTNVYYQFSNESLIIDRSNSSAASATTPAMRPEDWSWYAESTQLAFFHGGSVGVEFGNVTVWEGLVDAWPARSY